MNGGDENDSAAVDAGAFGEGDGGQTPEDIRAALAAPGHLDPERYAAAVEAGAVVERYPRDSVEDLGEARARYREHAPGRWSWSVARRRDKGDQPVLPDRVARGDCASLGAAREAVEVMVPWVLVRDGG